MKKKKKENQNPFERWTFKLFKKANIDDANDTPRRELIWNEGTNQGTTQIYTTLPSLRSHRFVTVRDWPLPCALTPHWLREPAALPIFSHSTLLLSPSLRPRCIFLTRWANSNGLCMQAHGNYLSLFPCANSVELALRELPTSADELQFCKGILYAYIFSLYSKYTYLGLYIKFLYYEKKFESWCLNLTGLIWIII